MASRRQITLLLIVTMVFPMLAGCTGLGGPPEPNARVESDRISINAGESVNFDARASTSPESTVITEYQWNFGDGQRSETVQGYTSHTFIEAGIYEISVTVVNDLGGDDTDTTRLVVNGFPQISLSMPTAIRTGDVVTLDASGSSDPENGELTTVWDLDWDVDSDNDGDATNDNDAMGEIHRFTPYESGNYTGSVTISDESDASATRVWNLSVLPRTYQVIWEERTVTYDWDGYLEQSQIHTITHTPGEEGRIMSFNATLTLAMDIIPVMLPQDNFSLTVDVPRDDWSNTVRTEQSNITQNASASMEYLNLNPTSENTYNFSADSLEELLEMLNAQSGAGFGEGDWMWIIEAEEADPDFPIDEVDPDGGNEWELVVEITFLVPRINEVGV
ncbi:MAG: PKD domain-containing protein [Candidatus Thalassarchaeaceae archaeon]|nr:PKD domain-containing protein [Candidatus Thalassarchaeaceae archaeon]